MLSWIPVVAFILVATSALPQYCPKAYDLQVAYGSPTIRDGGWTISGGGGASTKSSFNILGGSVEFDVDFSRVNVGVNGNIYTISPTFGSPTAAFNKNANYCDGQGAAGSAQYCIELDWIETNGNCGAATTLHTRPGGGTDGCTAWGCTSTYNYNGRASFHMKISHAADGTMTVVRDGVTISSPNYNPGPQSQDIQTIRDVYASKGAVIYSSLWTGWVPTLPVGCSGNGDLGSSYFTVSNLKITGTVVQGPTPTLCTGQVVVPVQAPVPVTAPRPVPVTQPVAQPVPRPVPVTQPVAQPVSSGGCSAALYGTGNNDWWNAVKASAGTSSVRITCTDTSVASSCKFGWTDSDGKPVWQCQMSGACKNPQPTCTKSASRLDEETEVDPSTGLANWAIALIALAAVLAGLLVVVAGVFFVRKSNQPEHV